jgi:hypothetical protein
MNSVKLPVGKGVDGIFVFRVAGTILRFKCMFLSDAWKAVPAGARFLGVDASYPVVKVAPTKRVRRDRSVTFV